MIRKKVDRQKTKKNTLLNTLIMSCSIVFLDAFFFNQGFLAGLTYLVVLLYFLPVTFFLIIFKGSCRIYLTKGIFYLLASLIAFTVIYLNQQVAEERADMLIRIIEKYRQDKGEYPKNLKNLIPEYINLIPLSHYTMTMNQFNYELKDDDILLSYIEKPPYIKPTYSFKKKDWILGPRKERFISN